MKIGDLAKASACAVETVRYYEQEGLLPGATRSSGNYRLYGPTHVERLIFIRHCRSLDMTLEEIRTLLAFRDAPDNRCADVNALLDAHIGHVAQRMRELRVLERELKLLRAQCSGVLHARSAQDCKIMQSLARRSNGTPTALQGRHGRLDRTHK
ncbi:MAG: Cd(II)/Pb(II)-responsive transcriptional regulator [Burkholderiaceae bacterium]